MECSAYSDLSVNGAAVLIRRNAVLATDINLSIKCIKNINFHYENRSPMTAPIRKCHCVKYVQMQGFFWSVFSRIRTEYGEILPNAGKYRPEKTPYLDTSHAVEAS